MKGSLFVDYVRMLRARKDVDWGQRLAPEDLPYLTEKIEPEGWYPMLSFERMGLAILNVVANGDLELVRAFGQAQVEGLATSQPMLVAPQDPRESLMRFQVLRQSFFNFPALEARGVSDEEASFVIDYKMGDAAEEAASFQAMGFFERLLALAGARDIETWLERKRWTGEGATQLELRWR